MNGLLLPLLAFVATASLVVFFAYDLLFDTPLEKAVIRVLGRQSVERQPLFGLQVAKALEKKDDLTVARRLSAAGFDWTPGRFWLLASLPALLGAGAVVVVWGNLLAASFVGLLLSVSVPRLGLAWLEKRRGSMFQEQLPAAVEVLVRGARSGLPLHECVRLVATEGPQPIAGEFRGILHEQAIGRTLSDAFGIVASRIGTPEANLLATVVQVQSQTGGNVAEILEGFAGSLRARAMLREKIKTITAESRLSAYMLAVLPVASFKIVENSFPEKTRLLFDTPSGNLVLFGIVVWTLIGIVIVFKMVNMKV